MKAAVFYKAGTPLVVERLADPTPLPHEVVVKIGRCGICTSDIHMTETSAFLLPGDVLGHECAGEVVACGTGVTSIRAGDHVAILPTSGCGYCVHCLAGEPKWCNSHVFRQGGYAEYILAHEANCIPLPSTVSLIDGALVEPMAVALHGVMRAGVTKGSRVLVIGAGPIGLAAMFWARRLGAVSVVGVATSSRQEALASTMGADAFLVDNGFAQSELAETIGGIPDIVLECSGASGLIARSIDLVKPRGTIGVLGFCMGTESFSPVKAVAKEISLQFAMTYSRQHFEQAIAAFDQGAVEPRTMITETIGLEALPDMFEMLRGRTPQCKVHMNPWL